MQNINKKRWRRVAWGGLTVAVALTAVAAVMALKTSPSSAAEVARDMKGNVVELDTTDADQVGVNPSRSKPVADIGTRFSVPSVGLDVPVGQLNEVDGVITPPGFKSVYRVANRGVDPAHADEGTVYVVTHSMRGGGIAPGNYLIDVKAAQPSVADGAKITVSGVQYTVDKSFAINKAALPARAEVWANTPDRLVVITCLQNRAGTPSTQNVVIEAHKTTSSSAAGAGK